MEFEVEISKQCRNDLAELADFLFASYLATGDDDTEAAQRALARLDTIRLEILKLGSLPYQGTLRPALSKTMRWVTKIRVIFYYEVDDERQKITVLATFFGGQNHTELIRKRITGSP